MDFYNRHNKIIIAKALHSWVKMLEMWKAAKGLKIKQEIGGKKKKSRLICTFKIDTHTRKLILTKN